MPGKPLHRELEYFIEHQDELVKLYGGKVIVIKGESVMGTFASVFEAVQRTSQEHELGSFMVQRCEPGPACYTAIFHGYRVSRAAS